MTANLKKYLSIAVFMAIVFSAFALSTTDALAAQVGSTMLNPVKVTYGETYSASWDVKAQNVYFYNEVAVDETGLLKMTFLKPYDDDGECARLEILVYNEDGEPIWSTNTYEMDRSATPFYKFQIGLKPGTYYVAVGMESRIVSGAMDTEYSFDFEAKSNIEIEPNSTTGTATQMKIGKFYSAVIGNAGGDYGRDNYFKVKLKAKSSYRLMIDNFGPIDETTAIIDMYGPSDTEIDTFFSDFKVNSDGYHYLEFVAPEEGTYYIKVRNYYLDPIKYRIKVSNGLKPKTTKIESFYGSTADKELRIRAEEKSNVSGYQIQYSTSKDKVKSAKKRSSSDCKFEISVSKVYKKYYARVRTYKYIDGKKVYSTWSSIKSYT